MGQQGQAEASWGFQLGAGAGALWGQEQAGCANRLSQKGTRPSGSVALRRLAGPILGSGSLEDPVVAIVPQHHRFKTCLGQ